ncbi:MAG: NAD-dependent epimerase/dehydratase family protein [Verrucomicrobia bacterium]|nr:NAD-dependent epimerase/dehydratase family protein [Verrucomicrobiota bacterium]
MTKVLISGICGFAGSSIAHGLLDESSAFEVSGVDNLSRPGSQVNVEPLRTRGVKLFHGDVRSVSDLELIPCFDWLIDAAANPSVLAGVSDDSTSRQVFETNLYGTINLLELAKKFRAGFLLLSTSRVYSARQLSGLPMKVEHDSFRLDLSAALPNGVTAEGVNEQFSTEAPRSLYGSSKLASEIIALEYGEVFEMPVWINRCGVLAGAGQFGRPDQGIFSFWINAYLRRKALRYIGFGGGGYQVRDCLHPKDLVPVLHKQMLDCGNGHPRMLNFGGGNENSMSLLGLSEWCAQQFGRHEVKSDKTNRCFDVPWLILNSGLAERTWSWRPATKLEAILDQIARHADAHPEWLRLSGVYS